jgi:hypothetical protein
MMRTVGYLSAEAEAELLAEMLDALEFAVGTEVVRLMGDLPMWRQIVETALVIMVRNLADDTPNLTTRNIEQAMKSRA